jgi:hypothetical protein
MLCDLPGQPALFRTQLEMRNGDFRISFGEPSATSVPEQRNASFPVSITREEVQVALQQAVQRFQEDQESRMQQELRKLQLEVEAKRHNDMKQVVRGFKFLEETQSLVWKEVPRTLLTWTLSHETSSSRLLRYSSDRSGSE